MTTEPRFYNRYSNTDSVIASLDDGTSRTHGAGQWPAVTIRREK